MQFSTQFFTDHRSILFIIFFFFITNVIIDNYKRTKCLELYDVLENYRGKH